MSRFIALHQPSTSLRAPNGIRPRKKMSISEDRPDAVNLTRDAWIARCAMRLNELLPATDPIRLLDLATDLWTDVSTFDPAIAAEMEYESRDT